MEYKDLIYSVLVLFLVLRSGTCRSTGAPSQACSSLTPSHSGSSQPSSTSPYQLELVSGNTYAAGGKVTVLLSANPRTTTFKGVIMQARQVLDGSVVGSWQLSGSDYQHLACPGDTDGQGTITHTDGQNVKALPVRFTWNAPVRLVGDLEFQFSVVQDYVTYWTNMKSSIVSRDSTPPVVTCPADFSSEVQIGSSGKQESWALPTVTDNSGSFFYVSSTHNPNDFFPVGETTIMYTYRDASNNINTCSFTLTIVEVTSPTPPCLSNPCLNGATCLTGTSSYVCSCTAGFTGTNCQSSCAQSSVVTSSGNLTFPQTRSGQTAQTAENCSSYTFRAGMPLATRECVGDLLTGAEWLEPVITDCSEGGDVNNLLDGLANVEVTPENVDEIVKETVSLSLNYSSIDEIGIQAIAEILNNIVMVKMNASPEIAAGIIEVVSNVQEVDQETFDNLGNDTSPSLIIQALETYITALQMNYYPANITEIQDNIAVMAVVIPQQSLQTGLGFASITPGSGMGSLKTEDISIYYEPNSIPVAEVTSSILVPAAVLDYITPGESVPISFFLYQTSKLFRSPSLQEAEDPAKLFRRAVGSHVIAATVEGVNIENLSMDQPVVSAFLHLNVSDPDEMINGSQCVFWDFSLNVGFGDWSSEGCSKALVNNSRTVCHCNHLTSFAVIVDIYGNQENVVLSIISKIGCAVSVVALIITIITYLYIKKLRTKRPRQILICFSFSLLGLYLVFLTGIEATKPAVGCTIVAVLIHFFTLASVAWMAVEATNMYLLFVKVLNANVSHFMLIASVTAWGLPLLVVVIILAVDHTNYGTADYCFLKPGNAFYFGQILIIGFVLLFNFIIFTLVMRRLTCARKGISSTSDRGNREETLRRLQNAVIISVLLGLTWVFGLLSLIETANFVFQILFCIFNSLQGLMIFILFCLRQQEIRKAWVAFFKCGDDRQAKYSNKAGATSRGSTDTKTKGTIPLTNQSTNSTG
ncbi:adhesion G-protein coupled receptor G7-like [Asterias amurensis]|uniref:adhesion G-protein coupled receptor G7-like n=1 Tax=Asterias amurensis TaxID=7602 RepID=UPI003AB24961